MAEVNTDKGGKGGKNKQKKQTLRVDFTPMVDMNMLLITFFMFCTSLSKPQTMEISLPTKDKVEEAEQNKAKASTAVTVLLGANDKIFYYLGEATTERFTDPSFLVMTNVEGLRKLLEDRNTGVLREIKDLKTQLQSKAITKEQFEKERSEIKKVWSKKDAPTVMIKPTELSTYKNLVDALDEMQICNIPTYAIQELAVHDKYLLFTRTGNKVFEVELPKAKGKKK